MPPQDFTKLADGVMNRAVGVFGKAVTYIPKSGAAYAPNGIFDNVFEQVDPDTERIVASNQPNIGFRKADLQADPVQGDKVIVDGKTYRVIDAQEDGIAGVRVMLHEVTS
jgi:hypothetical protein